MFVGLYKSFHIVFLQNIALGAVLLLSTGNFALQAMEMPPTPVRVAPILQEATQPTTRLVGSLEAVHRVNVAVEETDLLVELLVDRGEHVEKGQVLARLETSRLEAEAKEIEASVEALLAATEVAKEQVARAEADEKALSKAAAVEAVSALEASRARNELGVAQAILIRREAELQASKARLKLMQVRIDDLTVKAPFSGHIVAIHLDAGSYVQAGDALLEIISDKIEVRVDVPERFWNGVSKHIKGLSFRVDKNSEVISLDNVRVVADLDPASRTFPVVATLTGEHNLAPGLSVLVDVPVAAAEEHILVPAPAVIRGAQSHMFVVRATEENAPPIAALQPVQVLFATAKGLAVKGPGLNGGGQVVVEGNERLRPGSKVQVLNAGAAQ